MPNRYKHPYAWIHVEQSSVSAIVLCPNLEFKELIHNITCMGGDMAYFALLLGNDFQAKVSDFGLVKLAPKEKNSMETK